jgi:hypothetical protein
LAQHGCGGICCAGGEDGFHAVVSNRPPLCCFRTTADRRWRNNALSGRPGHARYESYCRVGRRVGKLDCRRCRHNRRQLTGETAVPSLPRTRRSHAVRNEVPVTSGLSRSTGPDWVLVAQRAGRSTRSWQGSSKFRVMRSASRSSTGTCGAPIRRSPAAWGTPLRSVHISTHVPALLDGVNSSAPSPTPPTPACAIRLHVGGRRRSCNRHPELGAEVARWHVATLSRCRPVLGLSH